MEGKSGEKASIVSFIDQENVGHRCGYCEQSTTSYTDDTDISEMRTPFGPKASDKRGMWAHTMTCQDYQDLIDRGWRRSGQYVYKFNMKKTCCPAYTIRCDARAFKPTKSQKKVMKTMAKYLCKEPDTDGRQGSCQEQSDATVSSSKSAKQRKPPRKGDGADPNLPQCKKAKVIRQMRKEEKQAARAFAADHPSSSTVSSSRSVGAAKAATATAAGASAGDGSKTIEEFLVDALPDREPAHQLTLRLVKSDESDVDFIMSKAESFALYQKYQERVHGDRPCDCDNVQWIRFLVTSPLIHEKRPNGPARGYGSFHQQYYLDGKLIAVGVMDILPNCVSSVYVYYDPDLPQLSLGTYTALREIIFTRQLHASTPDIQWYYMGYYIHTCPKMKYKGNYYPSFLACPERYTWVPIEQCIPKLDASRYSRLDSSESPPEEEDVKSAMNKVPIFTGRRSSPIPYLSARSRGRVGYDETVKHYVQLAGKVSSSMLLVLR